MLRLNKELVVRKIHDDFLKLIDGGIGLCGRIDNLEYCDKCRLVEERIVFPISELAPIQINGVKSQSKKRRKGKKDSKNSAQGRLF